MKYVFDFDNTVVFSDAANNAAYNEVLELFGLPAIKTTARITRRDVFERYLDLTEEERVKIVREKQKHYSPELTVLNQNIIDLVIKNEPENCVLWSRADSDRVERILDYHGIRYFFSDVIISPKKSINEEIAFLCSRYSCRPCDLVIYDDEPIILKQINEIGCETFLCKRNCILKYE